MEWGVQLPHMGRQATRDNIAAFATTCDEIGVHSLFTSDHIAWPRDVKSKYPYTDDGHFPAPDGMPWLDPIGTLFFAAAMTQRVKLGITVLILGYRGVVATAKAFASLDALSGGRALMSAGIGWMREEFEALQMPYDHRGKRADEALEAMEALFSTDWASYDGEFTHFPPLGFFPRPEAGRIPVWVGGDSEAAYKRTARFADVFHAAFQTEEQLARHRDGVRRACEAIGRDPRSVQLSTRVYLDVSGITDPRKSLSGSPEQMADTAGRIRDLGYTHLLVDPAGKGGPDKRLEALRSLMADVAPLVD